ncbi:hypothetical protein [Synechococcus elongatus]|uniref:hypothetical protein n=1 Tax=Synechococcus elongatus TaxID=32046 RepID=UPI0002E9DFAD|nr:hypothetical protein [Synechococcus elongatus]MBD2587845.1 hypothetical protein [Synechococcus elongatus FACHB-242]MBD2688913.1 hypothetical protein [Synechococcus elongatus FACHB-1061]MBD2707447.1 hypothetical protein [Synechococcus elongatus PCC 7942 = FACHB-805]
MGQVDPRSPMSRLQRLPPNSQWLLVIGSIGVVVGALVGWTIGQRSLAGVRAPETAPLATRVLPATEAANFLSEQAILKRIQALQQSQRNTTADRDPAENSGDRSAAPRGELLLSLETVERRAGQLRLQVRLEPADDQPVDLLAGRFELMNRQGNRAPLAVTLPAQLDRANAPLTLELTAAESLMEGSLTGLTLHWLGSPSSSVPVPLPALNE